MDAYAELSCARAPAVRDVTVTSRQSQLGVYTPSSKTSGSRSCSSMMTGGCGSRS